MVLSTKSSLSSLQSQTGRVVCAVPPALTSTSSSVNFKFNFAFKKRNRKQTNKNYASRSRCFETPCNCSAVRIKNTFKICFNVWLSINWNKKALIKIIYSKILGFWHHSCLSQYTHFAFGCRACKMTSTLLSGTPTSLRCLPDAISISNHIHITRLHGCVRIKPRPRRHCHP